MRVLVVGVAVVLAGCGAERGMLQEADVVGAYSATFPGPSGAPRDFTLTLAPGNVADLMSVSAPGVPVVETGTWTVAPGHQVRVVLARGGLGAVTTDVTFRLRQARLTAATEDSVRWGTTQLVFERQVGKTN
ncbi:MAG: hypothetical protein OER21_12430 [Gemmatimonadota bacterium]|nr:hypothetical protein [Gemmatimonadota bacterium]